MGQVGHGCATTTHAVRAAIQRSQASLATLSRELGAGSWELGAGSWELGAGDQPQDGGKVA
jgi:hypothetical protein